TKLFLTPFSGIFKVVVSKGSETQSVLEPPLIIAMIVYALLAWGIAKLVDIISNQKDTETL
ncbi:MAG: YggT family protein, partial [Clostridiaceae bacterium]|nr:YggT family protein [Clostridiaceae bacterium]